MDLRREGNWAILTPADRFESALDFTPRAAVGDLMRSVAAKGLLDVRDYARYAFQTGRLLRYGLGEIYLMLYDRSVASGVDNTDWDSLRLYGSFDTVRQRALEAGGRVPFQALVPAQKSIAHRIAYKARLRSEEQLGDGSSVSRGRSIEPTEAFPNGLPPNGSVSAGAKSVRVLVAYGKGSDGRVRPLRQLNVWTLAAFEAERADNPDLMRDYSVPGLVGYAPGAQKLVSVRVELAPGVWRESAITVADYDVNAKPVPWDKLPKPWVDEIRAAIERQKAQKDAQPKRTIPPSP